ncbi:MAG: hypothetical protein Q8907_14730 [Bacteroidota bacterium]|nr:hypothetical protein [Bacteroidota bacterium]MDP4226777.1 hypothetical protein [Bacteroidota bacterium]MDP4275527.1 hypothetical protein [Bacteroidota bacterium]
MNIKKIIEILTLAFIMKPTFSQTSYFFEPIGRDSIKIYFNEFGDITLSDKAAFYRIGKMDHYYFSFDGEVKDFSKENILLFTGHYKNGKLNGLAQIYENGELCETGNYKNDVRDSIWTYYLNNQIEKKVDFSNGQFKLLELYDKKGVSKIKNGVCTYTDNVRTYKNTVKIHVNGTFKNGLLDGKLNYGNSNTEYYENGIFKKGDDKMFHTSYYEHSKIDLISYYPSESIDFYYNFFTLVNKNNCTDTLFFPKFNKIDNLDISFYKSLKDTIIQINKEEPEESYYLVDMGISKESKIDYVHVFSPQKNNKAERISQIINNLGEWETSRCETKFYTVKIYFPIVIENNNVIIPQFTGRGRGEIVNSMFQMLNQK